MANVRVCTRPPTGKNCQPRQTWFPAIPPFLVGLSWRANKCCSWARQITSLFSVTDHLKLYLIPNKRGNKLKYFEMSTEHLVSRWQGIWTFAKSRSSNIVCRSWWCGSWDGGGVRLCPVLRSTDNMSIKLQDTISKHQDTKSQYKAVCNHCKHYPHSC